MDDKLGIEKLDCYRLAVDLNRRIAGRKWPAGRAHLRDQAIRAADSMVLNIAEGIGRGRRTAAGRNHFRIAKGSVYELFAVVDILGLDEHRDELRRMGAMLGGLGA